MSEFTPLNGGAPTPSAQLVDPDPDANATGPEERAADAAAAAAAAAAARVTAPPPVDPLVDQRGQDPEREREGERFGGPAGDASVPTTKHYLQQQQQQQQQQQKQQPQPPQQRQRTPLLQPPQPPAPQSHPQQQHQQQQQQQHQLTVYPPDSDNPHKRRRFDSLDHHHQNDPIRTLDRARARPRTRTPDSAVPASAATPVELRDSNFSLDGLHQQQKQQQRDTAAWYAQQAMERDSESPAGGEDDADDAQSSPAADQTGTGSATGYDDTFNPDHSRDSPVQADLKKRKRNFSNRTKTGCMTCRKRKKKCDELKPECSNCLRGGFICQGYSAQRGTSGWPRPESKQPVVPLESKDPSYVPPGAYGMPQPQPQPGSSSTPVTPSQQHPAQPLPLPQPQPQQAQAQAQAQLQNQQNQQQPPPHPPPPPPPAVSQSPIAPPRRESLPPYRGQPLRINTPQSSRILTDDDRLTASTLPSAITTSPDMKMSALSAYTQTTSVFPTPISAISAHAGPPLFGKDYQRVPPLHDRSRTEPESPHPASAAEPVPRINVLRPSRTTSPMRANQVQQQQQQLQPQQQLLPQLPPPPPPPLPAAAAPPPPPLPPPQVPRSQPQTQTQPQPQPQRSPLPPPTPISAQDGGMMGLLSHAQHMERPLQPPPPLQSPQRSQRPPAPDNGRPPRTAKDDMLNHRLFSPFDHELVWEKERCDAACWRFNNSANPGFGISAIERMRLFREIVGPLDPGPFATGPASHSKGYVGEQVTVEAPFACEFGYNLFIGRNVVVGRNCTIIDAAEIRIGDNCRIGPNVSIYGVTMPTDPKLRRDPACPSVARAVTIHEDCFIGGSVVILPGRTVGRGSTVGAGSVVTKDVPPFTVVAGNPAVVIHGVGSHCDEEVRRGGEGGPRGGLA